MSTSKLPVNHGITETQPLQQLEEIADEFGGQEFVISMDSLDIIPFSSNLIKEKQIKIVNNNNVFFILKLVLK